MDFLCAYLSRMGKKPTNKDVHFWRDPDLPGVEVRYSSYNDDAFRKHTHKEYSVGLLETGQTSFELEGHMYTAVAGQLVLIGPDVVHACNPDLNIGMTYRMFYLDKKLLRAATVEYFGKDVGLPQFSIPVVDDSELVDLWRTLHQAIIDGSSALEKESLLVQGMVDLVVRHAEFGEAQDRSIDAQVVSLIKEHLASNLSEKVSLDELSRLVHVSRYHLLRVFQEAVGLPPHAYQNQLRVELGKELLSTGISISQAAAEAGFVDQSHFSRVFKQYTGATPRQYQASVQANL